MSDIVPFIFSAEQDLLRQEISGKFLSVIFDGTRVCDAMAIIVHYVVHSTETN